MNCYLETQKTGRCNNGLRARVPLVWTLTTCEAGALKTDLCLFQPKKSGAINSTFLQLFVLFRPSVVCMMSTHTGKGNLFYLVHQLKC